MLDDIVVYPSFADAKADRRQTSWHTSGLQASRFAIHGNRIYAAWHSTDKVLRAELPLAATPDEIPLVGYNGWILGLDALDDRTLAVAVSDPRGALRIVDTATGETVKTIAAPDAAGIKCRTVEGFTAAALSLPPSSRPSPPS